MAKPVAAIIQSFFPPKPQNAFQFVSVIQEMAPAQPNTDLMYHVHILFYSILFYSINALQCSTVIINNGDDAYLNYRLQYAKKYEKLR